MNRNEIPQMHNDDALELANQMQRRKTSEQSYDEVLEISEEDIERKKVFRNWIAEEARKHEDHLEFYKAAENEFLDKMMYKQYLGNNNATQLIIRKEAFKLANKGSNDLVDAAEKIYDILIQYQENDDVQYTSTFDHDSTPEQVEDKTNRQQKLEEYFETEIFKVLDEYHEKTKDDRVYEKIKAFTSELLKLSHGDGELVEKIQSIKKSTKLAVENTINYPHDYPLMSAASSFKRELERRDD